MKRELAFALQTQCELTMGLGRTRASKVQILSGDSNKGVREGRSGKRFKANESKSNGQIAIDQNQEKKVTGSQCNGVDVYRRTRRYKENVITDKTKCNLDEASTKEELRDGSEKPFPSEEGSKVVPMAVDESNEVANEGNNETIEINDVSNELTINVNDEVNNCVLVEAPRRFTRSMLNSEACIDEKGIVLSADANGSSVACASGTEAKKLEMKMSKKIALQRIPKTTKELFSTGLLEGYSVFYNGGGKATVLRGMIKDNGILCFCSLCKGSEVVCPRVFEIHACKSYRRAAQYICLENGKSLLEVVKACRNSPLDMLEETIQNVITQFPEKEYVTCHDCKGSFLPTAEKMERLCPTCVGLKNSEAAITEPTDTNARSLQPISAVRRFTRSANVIISSEDTSKEKIAIDRSLKQALSTKSSGISSVHILSPKKNEGTIEQNSSRSPSVSKSTASASAHISSKSYSRAKITKKVLKPVSARKSSGSASVWISSQHKNQSKITKKSSEAILSPSSSKNASLHLSPQEKSKWKITKKDQGLHKLVFEDGGLPDGTEVAYYSRGKKLLEGYKKGMGIFCGCCNSEVSASQFETHAGWASRKKPYQYIYTSNGVSLHEFAISLLKDRKHSAKDNDDLCIICADGGNLLLCDVCPRAFHIECASLTSIPRGKWYCQYCQNMFQREKFVEYNANALAAGRVSGVDSIEQITKRCIRIVKNPEDAEVIACVLCRGFNFRKSGFGPFTVIVCDQCEKEYHVGCLKKHKMADLQELPRGKWFCCMDCERIFSALQNLLVRGEEKIPDSLLDVMKRKHEEKVPDTPLDFDVRWRVLSGKIASPDTRLFLSKAVAIFHDCFDPIVDSATGRDFIPSMVYGRNIRGQDFAGMYCAVLTLNSCVVSAGIFRVFGQEIAELPLVATSNDNQGKGYFQTLFSCIEKLLAFLKVKWLVLPAASEAESIWTQKFGFEKIPVEQLSYFRKTCWQMLTFTGTSMLQKMVPSCRIIEQHAVDVSMESS